MAIQTVYYRQKIEGTGWRYGPLAVGRQPQAAKNGPYFIRVRNSTGKYQWVQHDTQQAAEKAAKVNPFARQAQELGLTVDELTNEANTNRISSLLRLGLLSYPERSAGNCLNLPSHVISMRSQKFSSPGDAAIGLKLTIQVTPEVTPERGDFAQTTSAVRLRRETEDADLRREQSSGSVKKWSSIGIIG